MTRPLQRCVRASSVASEALGREQSGLLQRQPPARAGSHTWTPLPFPPLCWQQQRSSEQLPRIQQNPQPGCAASSAEELTPSARISASPPRPPGSQTVVSIPRWRWAVDAKGWQGASGGGDGGMPAKALTVVARGKLE